MQVDCLLTVNVRASLINTFLRTCLCVDYLLKAGVNVLLLGCIATCVSLSLVNVLGARSVVLMSY